MTRQLRRDGPSRYVTSDSSGFAWGATCEDKTTGGPWGAHEKTWHINVKELLAVYLALQCFYDHDRDIHIRVRVDNAASVAYINKRGGQKMELNEIARQIWLWAKERNIWISAEHIPGVHNIEADKASRKQYRWESEWMLHPDIFQQINRKFGPFDVDLFATRLNHQCKQYFAWKPDPLALAIDAFAQPWTFNLIYGFPPFSLIGKTLQRLEEEGRTAFLILPLWTTQHWFSRALRMTVQHPRLLPRSKNSLMLPQDPDKVHPFLGHLKLTLFPLSGNHFQTKAFQMTLPKLSDVLGASPPGTSIRDICANGSHFVVNKRVLRCDPL